MIKMHKFAVLVNKGLEKVAVEQIRNIIGAKKVDVEDSIVMFECEDEKAFSFIYRSQIALRVLLLIQKVEIKQADGNAGSDVIDTYEFLSDGFIELLKKDLDMTFLKELHANGVKEFRAKVDADIQMDVTEIERNIGGIVLSQLDFNVNLKNPEIILYTYVRNDAAYIGVDISGDLSKRDYRVFNNAVSIKGTTAFGLLMLSGYDTDTSYLNPFCYSGTMEIEAALYSCNKPHRFYNKAFPFMKLFQTTNDSWDRFFEKIDSKIKIKPYKITGSDILLSSITAAVKNAKIAGVEECIDFKRLDMDWLDVKFEKKSFDKIITFMPGSSKHKDMKKVFKEFFYQAEYILKDDGVFAIMCLTKDLLMDASREHFELDKELGVESGSQLLYVLFFKKKLDTDKTPGTDKKSTKDKSDSDGVETQ